MPMLRKPKLNFHVLLTVGLTMGTLPAKADFQEVKRTEADVKEFDAKFGFAFSASQFARLAFLYLKNDMKENLAEVEATMAAETLEKMSNFYVPSVGFLNSGTTSTLKVVADKTPAAPNTVKASDYSRAECFQLRAIQQYSRLPDNDITRINAQRRTALWYRYLGQTQKEEIQTLELVKLMHTEDRALLFPG